MLARVVLPNAWRLSRGDLVALDRVLFRMECAHVFDKWRATAGGSSLRLRGMDPN